MPTFKLMLAWPIGPGGALRSSQGQRVNVYDPGTTTVPAGLTQDGQSVSWVTSDEDGAAEFTTTSANVVDVTTPDGRFTRRVESVENIGVGGGGSANDVQVSTLTLPPSPRTGQAVTVLADGSTTLPAGVTWDSGGAPTLGTERLLISLVWSGVDWVGTYGLPFAAAVGPDTTAPTTPTGLTATPQSATTVALSWTASTDNVGVTGYEYRINGGTAVDAGTGTTETVGGLTGATAYTFEVRAYDAAGNRSAWSTSAGATTDSPPLATFADTFTGDGALTGRALTTGTATWATGSGSFHTTAGVLRNNSTADGLAAFDTATDLTNIDLNVDLSTNSSGNYTQVVYRYKDGSNFQYLSRVTDNTGTGGPTTGQWLFYDVVGGTHTLKGTIDMPMASSSSAHAKIAVRGTTATLSVDGVAQTPVTVGAWATGYTQAGIRYGSATGGAVDGGGWDNYTLDVFAP